MKKDDTQFFGKATTLALIILCGILASVAVAQEAPVFTLVADTDEAVPGGQPGEVFDLLMEDYIYISGRCVAFLAVGDMGTAGVYRRRAGVLERVADASTAVPDGEPGDQFTDIDTLALEDCDTLFVGLVNDDYAGIYLRPATGNAEVVSDHATPVPDETGESFTDTIDPWQAGGVTGFIGLSNTCLGVPQAEQIRGLYFIDGGAVERVADNCRTGVPDGQLGEIFTDEISKARPVHDGTSMAFWGAGDNNTQGIFTTLGGTLRAVAVTGDTLPGGEPGEVFAGWEPAFQEIVSLEDGDIVFAAGGDFGTLGIFRESAGVLSLAHDLDDPLPGWQAGELLDLEAEQPALAWLTSGAITLFAAGDMGSEGIYRLDGVDVQTIVKLGDTLESATVTEISGAFHTGGDRIGFAAELSDGRDAVFIADLPLFADGFESGDTSDWTLSIP